MAHFWPWFSASELLTDGIDAPNEKQLADRLFVHPADLGGPWPPRDTSGRTKRIAVIGGGIAGLTAAFELGRANHNVKLLESSWRLGGRIFTTRFDQFAAEFGAMRIPTAHRCTSYYVKDTFKLDTAPFVAENDQAWFHLRDRQERIYAYMRYHANGIYNMSKQSVWKMKPGDVVSNNLQSFRSVVMPSVTDAEKFWDAFSQDPSLPVTQLLDDLSIWQFFCSRMIASKALTAVPDLLPEFTAEDWEYLGRASGTIWDEKGSALEAVIDDMSLGNPNKYFIVGGMDRLIEAFARELAGCVQVRCHVTHVTITDRDSVAVRWRTASGVVAEEDFDYVVCAAPADATSRVHFTPRLDDHKYEALTNLSYQSSAKALVYCRNRIWETNDGIYGGGSFTDLPLQQVWYPSDHARLDSSDTEGAKAQAGVSGDSAEIASVPSPASPGTGGASGGPGVLTAAYLWGTNARRFASMEGRERERVVIESLERMHPGISKEIVDFRWHSWDSAENPGGGAFAFFGPGEHGRYQTALTAPHGAPGQPQRVFFAGEHLAIFHAWIQSAIQSSLSAVVAILEGP